MFITLIYYSPKQDKSKYSKYFSNTKTTEPKPYSFSAPKVTFKYRISVQTTLPRQPCWICNSISAIQNDKPSIFLSVEPKIVIILSFERWLWPQFIKLMEQMLQIYFYFRIHINNESVQNFLWGTKDRHMQIMNTKTSAFHAVVRVKKNGIKIKKKYRIKWERCNINQYSKQTK